MYDAGYYEELCLHDYSDYQCEFLEIHLPKIPEYDEFEYDLSSVFVSDAMCLGRILESNCLREIKLTGLRFDSDEADTCSEHICESLKKLVVSSPIETGVPVELEKVSIYPSQILAGSSLVTQMRF
jgi:hypothetical protein